VNYTRGKAISALITYKKVDRKRSS